MTVESLNLFGRIKGNAAVLVFLRTLFIASLSREYMIHWLNFCGDSKLTPYLCSFFGIYPNFCWEKNRENVTLNVTTFFENYCLCGLINLSEFRISPTLFLTMAIQLIVTSFRRLPNRLDVCVGVECESCITSQHKEENESTGLPAATCQL